MSQKTTTSATGIEIEISPDAMEAFLRITKRDDGAAPTEADIKAALEKENVVFGVDEKLLRFILEDEMYNEKHLIAKGEFPVEGIDGNLKFLVNLNHDLTPRVDPKGNADYKSVNLVTNVKQGDKLIEIVPPVPGANGKNVHGGDVATRKGAPISIKLGNSVTYDPQNKDRVIASIDGNASLKEDSTLVVEPVFVVEGDVDYSTGNIDFNGTVIITGDVRTDFEVKAKGDIEIQGVVEDAKVFSESNVLLKLGCVGKDQGVIQAGGTITSKYVSNHHLIATGDITIGENILHSRIETEGNLLVSGKKGSIIGGEVFACLGVEAKNLGSKSFPKTEITVGVKKEIKDKIENIHKSLQTNEKNSLEVSRHLFQLSKERKRRGSLPKDKMLLVNKLTKVQDRLKYEKEELPKALKELEAEMQQYANARVRVLNEVYPNVYVGILHAKLKISDETKQCEFILDDGVVRATSLKK